MCPIFVIKFSGVSDLQGVKVPDFPLTLLVIVTTVLRYRAACDRIVTDRRTDIFAAAYHIASRGQKCHYFACVVLLKEGCLNSESKMQDEAETETIPEETDTLTLQMASARPRRLAELNIATRVKPIPNYSSMFILSPSNRYTTFFYSPFSHS